MHICFQLVRPTPGEAILVERTDYLKFSQAKKNKMRKIRNKRIRKTYGYMIGYYVPGEKSLIVDQACIFGETYLLAVDSSDYYTIYHISGMYNIVELSPKKLRKLRKYLSNCHKWKKHSYVPIDSSGKLIQGEITGRDLLRKPFTSISVS